MIVYRKLNNLLKEKGMTWKDLCQAGISVNMPTKFSLNRVVKTDVIDKICAYLHVQPGDIMEWVEDEDELKQLEIKSQIAALEKQLADLKGGKS
jgi:putative transcriptional regulator|nr:MAG TPA: Cro/C1-type HTH DNA-binding domain protein [Bacteriophage sp.]